MNEDNYVDELYKAVAEGNLKRETPQRARPLMDILTELRAIRSLLEAKVTPAAKVDDATVRPYQGE